MVTTVLLQQIDGVLLNNTMRGRRLSEKVEIFLVSGKRYVCRQKREVCNYTHLSVPYVSKPPQVRNLYIELKSKSFLSLSMLWPLKCESESDESGRN